jgi:hypothetical protein
VVGVRQATGSPGVCAWLHILSQEYEYAPSDGCALFCLPRSGRPRLAHGTAHVQRWQRSTCMPSGVRVWGQQQV